MSRVLITGFEPFGVHTRNPSAELAGAAAGWPGVFSAVLPVSYARARARIGDLLESEPPRAWIALGLCAQAAGLRLERVARNCDDTSQPDNDGAVREGLWIVPEGKPTYPSTLPLDAMAKQLESAGIPIEWSDDAGGYLCNHVFYLARHLTGGDTTEIPCGLIHVPPFATVERNAQCEALRACVAVALGSR